MFKRKLVLSKWKIDFRYILPFLLLSVSDISYAKRSFDFYLIFEESAVLL